MSEDFLFAISKSPLDTMAELLFKSQKYMNAKNALMAKGMISKIKKEEEKDDHQSKKKDRKDQPSSHRSAKSTLEKLSRMVNFTPLVMPIEQGLMQIKDECKDLKEQIEWLIQREKL